MLHSSATCRPNVRGSLQGLPPAGRVVRSHFLQMSAGISQAWPAAQQVGEGGRLERPSGTGHFLKVVMTTLLLVDPIGRQ